MSFCFERSWMIFVLSMLFFCSARSEQGVPVVISCTDYVLGTPLLAEVSVFVYDTSSPHPVSLLGNFTTNGGKVVLAVPVGTSIFAVASSQYHRDTQTPIVTVPEEGLKDHLNQVNVQMVNLGIFALFWELTPGRKSKTDCQIVVTVCNYNKSIGDIPQGLPGASVSIEPKASSSLIYYFGTMLSNITNPLPNNLNSTSWDGGVLLENIPVNQNQLLTIRASKPGFEFSETLAACIWPGVFINGAPNQGPRVMNPSKK